MALRALRQTLLAMRTDAHCASSTLTARRAPIAAARGAIAVWVTASVGLSACGRSELDALGGAPLQNASTSSTSGGSDGSTGPGDDGGADTGSAVLVSCAAVQAANPAAQDGVYTIAPSNYPVEIQVRCLMSVDGGGWTLVSNFPWQGNTAGVPGWTSGMQVGSSFTGNAVAWKMPDTLINTIKTSAFRAHGTATYCLQGPCAVDTTLYWKATCTYSAGSLGATCGIAYLDPGFTTRPPSNPTDSTACAWHYGLVSTICNTTSDCVTSHAGNHEGIGIPGTFVHAYDGRPGENPSIQVWVR
jgi:hypothetical protein